MITTLIILGILTVFVLGFVQVYSRHSIVVKKIVFADKYRNKLIQFANKYFKTYDSWTQKGDFDGELYVWLTMNVSKIQGNLGRFGKIDYVSPFQTYRVPNYLIIINTIPKFRDGSIRDFDINIADDCLLRYLGYLEDFSNDTLKNLRNPIVWFREGFREILSIPIFILNWFGVISNQTVNSIKENFIYKVISGIIALITLVSGLVTIVVGYEQTMEFVNRILGK